MTVTRRDALKLIIAAPVVAAVGVSVHVHDFKADPSFWGYSCQCGARYLERDRR